MGTYILFISDIKPKLNAPGLSIGINSMALIWLPDITFKVTIKGHVHIHVVYRILMKIRENEIIHI